MQPTAPRVLLIEDDDAYAGLVREMLQSSATPPVVAHARTLETGVTHALAEGADVVIIDLGLPDSQGIDSVSEFVRRVAAIPAVVLTANDDRTLADRALQAGAEDYVIKGEAGPRELERAIRYAIERHRLTRDARELFEDDLTGNFVATADGHLLACNAAFSRMIGLADPEQAARSIQAAELFGGPEAWAAFLGRLAAEGRLSQEELVLRRGRRQPLHVLASATARLNERGEPARIRVHVYDLSAHKRLEEQFVQSQKMEAVGRLAGGIAHDFNNLLLVIGGQAERLLEEMPADSPLRHSTEAIERAAARAAGLTQQLLAFSRRQVLAPQVLDVNDVVRNVYGMLARLIGEDVQCVLDLAPAVHAVRADPGRLEQILMNLAVNARDAMPGGGTMTIGSGDVDVDEDYASQHLGLRPGRYVMFSVRDTGCGMDAQTLARIFEPFFTTKEVGKGTGLGLSMVYGIVKQSDGYIMSSSQPGVGTTMKVFLPMVADAVQSDWRPSAPKPAPGGSETILLVEDEDGVRELLEEILTAQGYRVLAASRGAEALQISDSFDQDIDVLVTDVVMPHMSGRELAVRLSVRRPHMRVLYLSGHTDDAISHLGVIDQGTAFLQKPFGRADLAQKVREVLSAPAR